MQIEREAEQPSFKNDTAIRPANSRSLAITPYHTSRLLLNTLGGENWERSGSTVYYTFTVPQDGMYSISLRALQDVKNNFTVFRRITLNDRVLFDELNVVPFPYSAEWSTITLGGADTPYRIFLEAGENVLGIEATNAPYHAAIEKIQKVLVDINDLSLDIKKLTGNQSDPFKEWVISDYIPDIKEQLLSIAADLREDLEGLQAIQGSGGSQEILTYQMAIDNIMELAAAPDEIPARMNRFSEGSGSAAQLLATLLPALQSQPLALDKVYIHSPDSPPPPVEVSRVKLAGGGGQTLPALLPPQPLRLAGSERGGTGRVGEPPAPVRGPVAADYRRELHLRKRHPREVLHHARRVQAGPRQCGGHPAGRGVGGEHQRALRAGDPQRAPGFARL